MKDYRRHIISGAATVKDALNQLNVLRVDLTLFVVDENEKLVGSLTDGDIRRGLVKDLGLETPVSEFMNTSFRYLTKGEYTIAEVKELRKSIRILPEVDAEGKILRIVNFNDKKSILPLDALIMAGGKGTRLRPLTENTPKPLLKVGDKPIIEYNVDRLSKFGVHFINISIKYLGEQLVEYFGNGAERGLEMDYIGEDEPLGTIGALAQVKNIHNDYVLVMNSDLLTDIDYEDFYLDFIKKGADMAVATVPYDVKVPYAVLELNGEKIVSFKEKPTYTYYSNGGIYIMKREVAEMVPKNSFYNATDLMEELIKQGKKVVQYPILGYWLDIGKHEDFTKAQEDVKHLKL